LIVSKFIPGFSTIAPPLAGAMGTQRKTFTLFSLSGGALWVTTGLTLGSVFHNSIDRVMDLLSTMGVTALIVIGSVLALIIGVKFYERRRFYKALRMARITADELSDMIEGGHKPVIVDARSHTAQQMEAPIPGALLYNRDAPDDVFINVSKSIPIIVYCSCPNEASAAVVAKQLINHGFREVRPLMGGLDAWNERAARNADHQPMTAQPG
jgi:rhodanese-related sulfurtransferase